jgi:hypothetical protein
MKKHVWIVGLLMILCLAGLVPVLANAAEPDKQALSDLLNVLDQKIKDADQRGVAHPRFLEELRAIVKEYRAKIRVVFLSEDFSDGDYYNNPKWAVNAGTFRVTKDRRLFSEVAVETPKATSAPAEKKKPFPDILKDILKTPTKEGETPSTTEAAEKAAIYTLVSIGPAFEMDLMLVSRSTRGSAEFVLMGGEQHAPYYRVIYRPSPSSERPIEIIRERDGKSFTIDTATQYPSLDDGIPHRIQWIRDSQGRMRILIDGKEVLATYEFYYQGNFTGFAFRNLGGTYEVGPIMVYQAQETKTQ